ncbi:hypothetical protein A3750_04805 [Oleiphilus sp. HI0079]|uniref:hypothetical protein n=1 Tax=Oleiphilus sp. HI0079 TaxID=1822254 RepID=UPI0007C24015|nr:hypothetical protein [Oleiphilus sp. HI0079]KZZ12845.1 hypothetical protein A3750_04805 [Oleiphilus sp. HI0079]
MHQQIAAKTLNSCTPNLIDFNVCEKAREISNSIANQLPMNISSDMVFQTVGSVNRDVVVNYMFTYDSEYLERTIKKQSSSLSEIKELMKDRASHICSGGEALKAFVNLGGRIVVQYTFMDGELFLRHIVEQCP